MKNLLGILSVLLTNSYKGSHNIHPCPCQRVQNLNNMMQNDINLKWLYKYKVLVMELLLASLAIIIYSRYFEDSEYIEVVLHSISQLKISFRPKIFSSGSSICLMILAFEKQLYASVTFLLSTLWPVPSSTFDLLKSPEFFRSLLSFFYTVFLVSTQN